MSEDAYRRIPSLHLLLESPDFARLLEQHARASVVGSVQAVLAELKQQIGQGRHTPASVQRAVASLHVAVSRQLTQAARYRLRRVLNATGVILHTNLGRAPLSSAALAHVLDTAGGYSNLELDLESGNRSRREVHVEELLLRVVADESSTGLAALVVNNCAAATFLALNTFAEGGEVIVSRGELVEIGGGFRIPEILAKSGAILREVGTTNRTRVADYEAALTGMTRLILRVHPSNFHMEGFVTRPVLKDLVSLGNRNGVLVFYDQGTGSVDALGMTPEPTLRESIRAGCDLIAASGDKLLGGPQCGLLLGSKDLVERLRKNPLYRTYRVDKLTYAALEATLMDYACHTESRIPLQRMLGAPEAGIRARCEALVRQVSGGAFAAEAIQVESLVGGGTAPKVRLASAAVALRHSTWPPQDLLSALRHLEPPVIGRIHEDRVLLDLRTVEPEWDDTLAQLLQQIG